MKGLKNEKPRGIEFNMKGILAIGDPGALVKPFDEKLPKPKRPH